MAKTILPHLFIIFFFMKISKHQTSNVKMLVLNFKILCTASPEVVIETGGKTRTYTCVRHTHINLTEFSDPNSHFFFWVKRVMKSKDLQIIRQSKFYPITFPFIAIRYSYIRETKNIGKYFYFLFYPI